MDEAEWLSHFGDGAELCVRGDSGQRSCDLRYCWRCISQGSPHFGNGCGEWFPVNDGVESVHRICCVLDDSAGTVRIHHGIRALHNVSLPSLILPLAVPRQGILDLVAVRVLGIGVVLLGNDGLGHRRCNRHLGDGGHRQRRGLDYASRSYRQQSGESNKLKQ